MPKRHIGIFIRIFCCSAWLLASGVCWAAGSVKDLSPDIIPGAQAGSWYQGAPDKEAKTVPAPQPVVSPSKKGLSPDTPNSDEVMDFDPEASRQAMVQKEDKTLPGGRVKMSGRYRIAAGADSQDFILNDSNADLQERNFRYLFGERLNNTYDPGIYSQYLVNLDFSPKEKIDLYTQIVVDPWSYVGTTGEQVQRSDIGGETIRYNLKYFGANNSMINEIWRTDVADSVAFPVIEVHDGHTVQTTVHGFYDFNPGTGGIPFTIPELDVDYELRPIRKLWMDYTEDDWHARVFALADQSQALTTDDPLGLSNHKDYWQQSPWLDQYRPIQHFSDGSVKRGYYSDTLSFLARDSEGNRLVLLRGASFEANVDRTYFVTTVAAPYTPWDEDYFDADNVPGAVRLKHQATDRLMVGGTYAFRLGLIDDNLADSNQVAGLDTRYELNEHTALKTEMAVSRREQDLHSGNRLEGNREGYAYKAVLESSFDHKKQDGHTDLHFSFAQMDRKFESTLSRYSNTRDDRFWGKHLTFDDLSPEMEYWKLGDGLDRDRFVLRAQWRESLWKETFVNLFDVRNVHRAENLAYKETVLRDEATVKVTKALTAKGLFRWHGLTETSRNVEPFLSNFYFPSDSFDLSSDTIQNTAIPEDRDPSRFTYSGGLQYVFNPQWTAEGIYERTNDIPDFPRGLLNGTFRDANQRVEGILTERLTTFLYGQNELEAVPPYHYFNIFRERVIFKPDTGIKLTFHAAQNGYKYYGGIDDSVNHEGVSVEFDLTKKWSLFLDVTHSRLIDVPHMIATGYTEKNYDDHLNVYASTDYKLSASSVFRAEYGVFGMGSNSPLVTPYSTSSFSLPTIDTEHLFRVSLTGDF